MEANSAYGARLNNALNKAGCPGNFGLWFYRFSRLRLEEKNLEEDYVSCSVDAGNEFLTNTVTQTLLQKLQERQAAQLATCAAGRPGWLLLSKDAKVEWRLIIGTSFGRVWDTSLQVHPLYGVPFLPASAIKGALRHYALERDPENAGIFGSQDARGDFTVFDAFALPRCREYFAEDVIGKHYSDYYENDPPGPPADYCEPKPIKFIAIAGGVTFGLRFAGTAAAIDLIQTWLADAAVWYGFGAKTRVNYGRFELS